MNLIILPLLIIIGTGIILGIFETINFLIIPYPTEILSGMKTMANYVHKVNWLLPVNTIIWIIMTIINIELAIITIKGGLWLYKTLLKNN